jgi:ABC-type lipoprotein release transport system permease subunit
MVAANDPILIQLKGNLLFGIGGALLLALIGFVVHFLVAGRGRRVEHAILEANGLEPADVRHSLALEQLLIASFGLLVAVLLAVIAVELLLPSLQFGSAPEDVTPPTVIRVDWIPVTLIAVGALLVAGLVASLTRRIGTAVDVVDEIRRLG